jgi:hypothetical protein
MEGGEITYNDCLEDYLRALRSQSPPEKFSIVDGSMCVCLEDHETVDHIMKKCCRFSSQRAFPIQRLLLSGVYEETPIRDLCTQLNWKSFKKCFMFLVECGVKM